MSAPSRIRRDRLRGQFFTEPQFAELLVAVAAGDTSAAADFAMGDGALLNPIARAYPDCRLFGADVDPRWVRRLRRTHESGSFRCGDALTVRVLRSLALPSDGLDIVVANPPFADVPNTAFVRSAIAAALGLQPAGKSVRAEVAFLAVALSALAKCGRLSIVLPHAVIAGGTFRGVRNAIAARYHVTGVYELPSGAFTGTEAQAYVLSLERRPPPGKVIELYSVNGEGNVEAVECVTTHEVPMRWDYTYWKWARTCATGVTKIATLADLGGELYRGHLSSAEARRLALPHFHTTDFARLSRDSIAFRNDPKVIQHLPRELRAGPGDILIPRIGTRCLGHQAMVSRGSAAITDCVYRIRLAVKHRVPALLSLASEQGVTWRRKSARGTCAKFLTREDMMHFPVQLT